MYMYARFCAAFDEVYCFVYVRAYFFEIVNIKFVTPSRLLLYSLRNVITASCW